MSAVALGVAAALVALRCQLVTDDPYVLGSVSRVLPATRPAFIEALNKTRRAIGCPVEGDVQPPAANFSGGQCPGIRYRVPCTSNFGQPGCPGGPGFGVSGTVDALSPIVFGPITGVGVRPTQQGECGPSVISHFISGFDGAGNAVSIDHTPVPSGRSDRTVTVTPSFGAAIPLDTEPPGGCGDAPGEYPEPTNFTTNIDVTYNIDNGDEVTVNLPFTFAPITVNFDGSLRIPVSFDLGGLEFSGNIDLPDFNFTLNPPSLPPGSGDDLSGEGDDEPGETTPPAPPGEKIIGVVVTATNTQSQAVTSYSTVGLTPIFVPRLGSVKFVYSLGAATFFSSDIDIKDRRTFIPCPFSQGADAVIASPNEGVTITFTPIRGFPLATTKDVIEPA